MEFEKETFLEDLVIDCFWRSEGREFHARTRTEKARSPDFSDAVRETS